MQVEFGPEDKRDPVNFSKGKKWAITIVASSFTVLAGGADAPDLPEHRMLKFIHAYSCCRWVIQPWVWHHDQGSELHGIPGNAWTQCLPSWYDCHMNVNVLSSNHGGKDSVSFL